MAVYSISEIEEMCGIKAHTLRAWEKRYGLLKPKRTETNIRYYTEEDMKFALNVSILYKKGVKISKLAQMRPEEIKIKVKEIYSIEEGVNSLIDALSLAIIDLDERHFRRLFDRQIAEYGFDHTLESVVFPLMDNINLMWVAGSINEIHEIFVLNIIKNKILVEVDKLEITEDLNHSFLLYLPPRETQQLSLYYMYYTLRKRGFSVCFLGDQIDKKKLKLAVAAMEPKYVFTIINDAFEDDDLQSYIDQITNEIESVFVLSGTQAFKQSISAKGNTKILLGLEEIEVFLKSII